MVSCDQAKDRLQNLVAEATRNYSIKNYEAAADIYSQATELQAEINGEMSLENADLLYAYGRCLYHVALRNSDVLGAKVVGESREEPSKSDFKEKKVENNQTNAPGKELKSESIEKANAKPGGKEGATDSAQDETKLDSKPYFQFTGDELFDDSDEDKENTDGAEADGGELEDDDFVTAYEVLDLARILLLQRLEEVPEPPQNPIDSKDCKDIRHLKERLADTYDLQAEISLEGERFPDAVADLKASLTLKEELYSQESSLIAEAHYKLSLALEFSSITQSKASSGQLEAQTNATVDEAMREEAAKEMEAAIASCTSRIASEEARVFNDSDTANLSAEARAIKENIADVKNMVQEMKQRLIELRQPPVSINNLTSTDPINNTTSLNGILGSIKAESPAGQKARLEEASKTATDVTDLVRRKKQIFNNQDKESDGAKEADGRESVGKRKADSEGNDLDHGKEKKVKINDTDQNGQTKNLT